ncbi:MAG: PKD domain-containing protein [Desulfomonilia bacterium]|nr:PKD domain-containing protein [Desulfomonilia bacterium]
MMNRTHSLHPYLNNGQGHDRVVPCAHLIASVLLVVSLLFLASCQGSSVSEPRSGSVSFSIGISGDPAVSARASSERFKAIPVNCELFGIVTIEAEVYDEEDNLVAIGGPWNCTLGEGHISGIPEGTDRTVALLLRDESGQVTFQGQRSGITVTAGETTEAGEILVTSVENHAPVFTEMADQTIAEGQTLTFTLSASDPDFDPLIFSYTAEPDLPSGATLVPSTGVFTWTPGSGDAGIYTITFVVSDGREPPGSDTQEIAITVWTPTTAGFTADPTSGMEPLTVTFTNTSSGTISSYLWEFGDGETSTEQNPSHTYSTAGTFTVTLTATGAYDSDATTSTITVNPGIVYVSLNGSMDNSGRSWENAVPTIQRAIDLSSPGGQIWVRYGTYSLDQEINISKSIRIYGGFYGGETQLDQRDWQSYGTEVFGGEIVRCFSISGSGANVTLDGLNINYASAESGTGGGVNNYNAATSLQIRNCSFTGNYALQGGAINNFNDSSQLLVINCTFLGNMASVGQSGGAVFSRAAATTVIDCVFDDNSAGAGGGISCYVIPSNTITIQSTEFVDNRATSTDSGVGHGGAILCWNDTSTPEPTSTCTITSSEFYYNTASYGAGISCINPTSRIVNCAFRNNTAELFTIEEDDGRGGAIAIWNSDDSAVINCTLDSNSAYYYGPGIYAYDSRVTIRNSIVWNHSSEMSPYEIDGDGENTALDIDYCNLENEALGGGNCVYSVPLYDEVLPSIFPSILATSPCRNAGDNTAPFLPDTDLYGQERINEGVVDIGAVEYR